VIKPPLKLKTCKNRPRYFYHGILFSIFFSSDNIAGNELTGRENRH